MDFGKEYFEFSKNEQGFDMRCCGKWQEEFTRMIIDVFDLKEGADILDFGAAMGAIAEGFNRNKIPCFGADVSQWYVDNCPFPETKKRMGVIVDNKIPFEDEKFSFVISHQTVEHIPEEHIKPLLIDIKRTIKPGSIIYISTVNPPTFGYVEKDTTHISCFERSKWEGIFKECGFEDMTTIYEPKLLKYKVAEESQWVNFMLKKKVDNK